MVSLTRPSKVGDCTDAEAFLGPIRNENEMQYGKEQERSTQIGKKGWKVALESPKGNVGNGYFVDPTITDNASESSRIMVNERCGPVVLVFKWGDEADR